MVVSVMYLLPFGVIKNNKKVLTNISEAEFEITDNANQSETHLASDKLMLFTRRANYEKTMLIAKTTWFRLAALFARSFTAFTQMVRQPNTRRHLITLAKLPDGLRAAV